MIELIPLAQEHVPALFEFEQTNKQWFEQWVPPRPIAYQQLDTLHALVASQLNDSLIKNSTDGMYLLFVNKTLVGRFNWVGSANTDNKIGQVEAVEVGYRMGEQFGGRGYATQGLELLIEQARKQSIKTLNAVTTETNVGSSRVLTKLGFKQNGTEVDAAELNGERVNLVQYQRSFT